MATDIILLRLGSTTMESAVVLEWLADVGDSVTEGDTIVILEADKVEVELPAPATGVLVSAAEVGSEIAVGATVGTIGSDEEATAERSASRGGGAGGPEDVEPAQDVAIDPQGPSDGLPVPDQRGRRRASPPARRLARELGVDLATVTGEGPAGRIMQSDVRRAAEAGTVGTSTRSAQAVRARIARRLSESARTVVAVTLHREIDATALRTRAAELKAESAGAERTASVEDMVILAVARALREHEAMNASWIDDAVTLNEDIHVNFAVQTPAGLVAPLLRHADRLNLETIGRNRREMTGRALNGGLTPDDVELGSFTVTNLGGFGIDQFTPTVSVPQVGVLGVGRITESIVALGRGFEVIDRMWLSLTFDHRAIDGAPAASFLDTAATLLEAQSAG